MPNVYENFVLIAKPLLPKNMTVEQREESDRALFLASRAPCQICGNNPMGKEDSLAVVEFIADGSASIGGVCKSCAKEFSGLTHAKIIDKIILARSKRTSPKK